MLGRALCIFAIKVGLQNLLNFLLQISTGTYIVEVLLYRVELGEVLCATVDLAFSPNSIPFNQGSAFSFLGATTAEQVIKAVRGVGQKLCSSCVNVFGTAALCAPTRLRLSSAWRQHCNTSAEQLAAYKS